MTPEVNVAVSSPAPYVAKAQPAVRLWARNRDRIAFSSYLSAAMPHFPLAGVRNLSDEWWCKEIPMPHDVYYQFIQTLEQARRVGARGGKATARKRRECLDSAAAEAGESLSEAGPQVHSE